MKNLLLIALSLFFVVSSFAMANVDSEEDFVEIVFKTGNEPGHGIGNTRPREFVPIKGVLYYDSSYIVLTFLANLGEVTITVNDANGNVVATSTCDSSVSNTATITVPTLSGSYTVSIVGEQFTGEGSYEL